MYYLISILIIVTCVLLTLIVLIQNSKGGGLAADFSSSNQVMGVRKTGDFLEKGTWALAIILLVLSLASNFFIDRNTGTVQTESEVQQQVEDAVPAPAAQPFPNNNDGAPLPGGN